VRPGRICVVRKPMRATRKALCGKEAEVSIRKDLCGQEDSVW
jgi:hypothetical protein